MSTVLTNIMKRLNDLTAKNADISQNLADLNDKTSEVLKLLSTHSDQIAILQTENERLSKQVNQLTEQVIKQD